MTGELSEPARDLREAMLAAYPAVVAERLAAHGIEPPDGLDAAVEEGRSWLATELATLLARPYGRQRRSPLELFQEAMRFPTEALEAAGVAPVERDEAVVTALPGDHYGLAPASSQDLGEEAWRAHIAWGAAKAAAMTRPAVAVLSRDLMDRTRIEEAVGAAGYRLVPWGTDDRAPVVVFVDLTHPDADEVIGSAARSSKVIAFGPHVDDLAMVRARTLGAADAVARSRFFRSIRTWLPEVV
ncbi:MAG: hypothetical protein R3290_07015 [Acidimicrobiia bacterium]|nr:hypothetical protein [Acidimicrobiia bacterium]